MFTRSTRQTVGANPTAAGRTGGLHTAARSLRNANDAGAGVLDTVGNAMKPLAEREQERIVRAEQASAATQTFQRAAQRLELQDRNGNSYVIRDHQGVVAPQMPDPTIPTLQSRALRAALETRYLAETKQQALETMTQIRADNRMDPQRFGDLSDAYIQQVLATAPKQVQGLVESKLRPIADSMGMDAINEKTRFDQEAAFDANARSSNEAFNEIVAAAASTSGMPLVQEGGQLRIEPTLKAGLDEYRDQLRAGVEMGRITPADAEEAMYNMTNGYVAVSVQRQLERMSDDEFGQLDQLKVIEKLGEQEMLVPQMGDDGEYTYEAAPLSDVLRLQDLEKLKQVSRSGMSARGAIERAQRRAVGAGFTQSLEGIRRRWADDVTAIPTDEQLLNQVSKGPWYMRGQMLQSLTALRNGVEGGHLRRAVAPIMDMVAKGGDFSADALARAEAAASKMRPVARLQLMDTLSNLRQAHDRNEALRGQSQVRDIGAAFQADLSALSLGPQGDQTLDSYLSASTASIDQMFEGWSVAASAAHKAGNHQRALQLTAVGTKYVAAAKGQLVSSLIPEIRSNPTARDQVVAAFASESRWNLSSQVSSAIVGMDNAASAAAVSLGFNHPDSAKVIAGMGPAAQSTATAQIIKNENLPSSGVQRRVNAQVTAVSAMSLLQNLQQQQSLGLLDGVTGQLVSKLQRRAQSGESMTDVAFELDAMRKGGIIKFNADVTQKIADAAEYQGALEQFERRGVLSTTEGARRHASIVMKKLLRDPSDPESYRGMNGMPPGVVAIAKETVDATKVALASQGTEAIAAMTPFLRSVVNEPGQYLALATHLDGPNLQALQYVINSHMNPNSDEVSKERGAILRGESTRYEHGDELIANIMGLVAPRAAEVMGLKMSDGESLLGETGPLEGFVRDYLGTLSPQQVQTLLSDTDFLPWDSEHWLGSKLVENIAGRYQRLGYGRSTTAITADSLAHSGVDLDNIPRAWLPEILNADNFISNWLGAFDPTIETVGQKMDRGQSFIEAFSREADWSGVLMRHPPERVTGLNKHQLATVMQQALKTTDPERGGLMVNDSNAPGGRTPATTGDLVLGINTFLQPVDTGAVESGVIRYRVMVQGEGQRQAVTWSRGDEYIIDSNQLKNLHASQPKVMEDVRNFELRHKSAKAMWKGIQDITLSRQRAWRRRE